MSVCSKIVISKMRIFNSRLLDPNQEHQALIPIENTPRGGWIDVLANLMINDVELKITYAN